MCNIIFVSLLLDSIAPQFEADLVFSQDRPDVGEPLRWNEDVDKVLTFRPNVQLHPATDTVNSYSEIRAHSRR